MKKLTLGSRGFSVFELLIGLVLLSTLVGVGYFVWTRQNPDTKNADAPQPIKTKESNDVIWAFDEQKQEWYVQSGKAPKCDSSFQFDSSPVDFSTVATVLFPGQYRGYNYKPHGAFRVYDATAGQVDIKMPVDAKITSLTRYLESPDNAMQYLVTFVNDCGIEIKFDHLATLSPRLQAIAETRPAAKLDDTRGDPNNKPTPELFKAGEVIATVIGHPNTKNYGFDFGVSDYREPNTISKNKDWVALHETYIASEWYGVCWFDMLPGEDADTAKKLSETPTNPEKPNLVSDYCKNAPKKTLDVNNGKPTDG